MQHLQGRQALRGATRRSIGALEVINKRDGTEFNDDDKNLLTAFAAVFLGSATLRDGEFHILGTLVGALIFGVGFGTLGYCPGTVMGAVGQGALDALFGGLIGMDAQPDGTHKLRLLWAFQL